MDPDQIANRLMYLLQVIETNEQRLAALIQALYAYSGVRFTDAPSMQWWQTVRRRITGRR
jgi:hypothetical protein